MRCQFTSQHVFERWEEPREPSGHPHTVDTGRPCKNPLKFRNEPGTLALRPIVPPIMLMPHKFEFILVITLIFQTQIHNFHQDKMSIWMSFFMYLQETMNLTVFPTPLEDLHILKGQQVALEAVCLLSLLRLHCGLAVFHKILNTNDLPNRRMPSEPIQKKPRLMGQSVKLSYIIPTYSISPQCSHQSTGSSHPHTQSGSFKYYWPLVSNYFWRLAIFSQINCNWLTSADLVKGIDSSIRKTNGLSPTCSVCWSVIYCTVHKCSIQTRHVCYSTFIYVLFYLYRISSSVSKYCTNHIDRQWKCSFYTYSTHAS